MRTPLQSPSPPVQNGGFGAVAGALFALPVAAGSGALGALAYAGGATAAVVLVAARGARFRRSSVGATARAEEACDLLSGVLDTVGLGILIRDEGRLTHSNRALEEMLGRDGEELLQYLSLVHLEDVEDAAPLDTVEPGGVRRRYERRLRHRDGRAIDTEITLDATSDGATVAVVEDVTERRRLERALLQAQKFEAIGRLAGGIAHDFNNLLTAVSGNAELLRRAPADEQSIDAIVQASERAAALARQLLQFSKSNEFAPEVVAVPTLVRSTVDLLRRMISRDVDVEARIAANTPAVYADPSQLDQVLLNLAVNAADAMPQGGTIRFDVGRWTHDGSDGSLGALQPGDYCRILVEDTGTGMDETTLARAFEPFFTTKEKGKGTGLGLATIHGIVTRARGHVRIDSEVGRGTIVQILLPAFEQAAAGAGSSGPSRLHAVA